MEAYIRALLADEGIELCGSLPLDGCHVTRRYLLDKYGIADGTVFVFAVPYYSADDGSSNISSYARACDYHIYMKQLSGRLLYALRRHYPEFRFAFFSDRSPLDERDAAARAGLGVIGKNGLLITGAYSSYVFLGEIITSADDGAVAGEVRYCENCGRCGAACPTGFEGCLSAITQKKGALTRDEEALMLANGSVWGCDICQRVCPHTDSAKSAGTLVSPVGFFNKDLLPFLTSDLIESMEDSDFARRAYSWRGRETIIRNLGLFEKMSGK